MGRDQEGVPTFSPSDGAAHLKLNQVIYATDVQKMKRELQFTTIGPQDLICFIDNFDMQMLARECEAIASAQGSRDSH